MLIFSLLLIFVSISILGATFVPLLVEKSSQMNKDQAQSVVGRVDRYMKEEELKKMYRLALLGPVIWGQRGFFFFPQGKI